MCLLLRPSSFFVAFSSFWPSFLPQLVAMILSVVHPLLAFALVHFLPLLLEELTVEFQRLPFYQC
jgi:hypothetical protein